MPVNDDYARFYVRDRERSALMCRPGGSFPLDSVALEGGEAALISTRYSASVFALNLAGEELLGEEHSLGDHYRHWDPAHSGSRRLLASSLYAESPCQLAGYDGAGGAAYLYRPVYDVPAAAFQGRWHRLSVSGEPETESLCQYSEQVVTWQGKVVSGGLSDFQIL